MHNSVSKKVKFFLEPLNASGFLTFRIIVTFSFVIHCNILYTHTRFMAILKLVSIIVREDFGFSYLREAIIDKIRKKITIKCRPHTKPKPWKVIHSVRVLNPSHFYSKTKACRELKHTHTHPLSVSAVNFYMKT